jgi:cold shock CspA family protein
MYGTITKIIVDRGFGFIRERGSTEKKELFFHCSELRDGLVFGEHIIARDVQYEIKETFKGPQAANIKPLE